MRQKKTKRTIWRDNRGRITHTGSLTAVTAQCGKRVWDVSTHTFMRLRK